MEKEFRKSVFYRSLMTAVFVGIIATLLTMFFDLIFVESLNFPLSSIINVASLIFAVNFLFLLSGLIYYACLALSRRGDAVYIALFVLLTAFFVWRVQGVIRSDDELVNAQFRQLLSGIILIIGICAAVAVPVLYHNKKFEDNVL